jgi:hypothetical protein
MTSADGAATNQIERQQRMTEPAKKLSRTERLLNTRQAEKPVAKQAQSPGKPGKTGSQKSAAPEQSANQPVEKKIGRPSGYSEERAREICERISAGAHLNKLVEEGIVPSLAAYARWTRDNEAFREAVARAQEDRAELWADQLIEIADTDEDANRARVRIDARWKVIGSLLYRRYGVKQSIDINQNVNVAVAHADALLRLAGQAKQIETTYKDVTPT